jgi:parallel beta-helix repeat protein
MMDDGKQGAAECEHAATWYARSGSVVLVGLAALGPWGCGDDEPATPAPDGGTSDASPCTVRVAPSDDDQTRVQTALIETPADSTICFEAGTYKFTNELTLGTRGITLRGTAGTVWDFRNQRPSARNGMLVTNGNFTVEDIVIKNTAGDGIRVEGVEGATFRRLSVSWEDDALRPDDGGVRRSGAYAVYPVGSSKILIEGCEVTGANDAGLYVGQSSQIIVRNNRVHGNVAGIEIENSTDADVYGNDVYDNTAGILALNIPDLPVQGGRRCKIHDNDMHENNHVNFGIPGTTVAGVPPGIGALVLAHDETDLYANTFRGNHSTAILIVSCFTNNNLAECRSSVPYEQFPQQTYVHGNTYENNGLQPADDFIPLGVARLEDIAWDGDVDTTKDNSTVLCIQETTATYRNFNSRGFFANPSTDMTPRQCMLPPLPPITL